MDDSAGSMLKRVKYVSVATVPFTPPQLAALLEKSRANNAAVDVTGALMMAGSVFFQMLEGPAMNVDAVYARILADSRHGSVQLLRTELTAGPRLFADWSMKLVEPAEVVLREHVSVRSLMERLDMMQRSVKEVSMELERVVWNHFSHAV